MARTPVGVAAREKYIVVVCDDGSTFYTGGLAKNWQTGEPIPGSEADESGSGGTAAQPSSPPVAPPAIGTVVRPRSGTGRAPGAKY